MTVLASLALVFGLVVGTFEPANSQVAPTPAPVVETNPTMAAEEGGAAPRSYGSLLLIARAMRWRNNQSFGVAVDYNQQCVFGVCGPKIPIRAGFNIHRYARRLLHDVYRGSGNKIAVIQELLYKAGSTFTTERCLKVGPASYCLSAANQVKFMNHWIYVRTDLDSTPATGIRESLIAAQKEYGCMRLTVIPKSNWTKDPNGGDCYLGGVAA